MENPPPGETSKSSTGLDENIAALLSYIFGWVSGLVFFLIEKNSRFVRFHAMQSLILSGGFGIILFILWFVAIFLSLIVGYASNLLGSLIWLLGMLLISVISLGVLIGWVMCLVKAFNKEYFKLPFIGNYAEKFSAK